MYKTQRRALNFTYWIFFGVVVSTGVLFSPVNAFAGVAEGDNELNFSLAFFHQQDSDAGTISGDGGIAHFLSDTWEVGFRQAITSNLVEDGPDNFVATTAPFLRYNFNYSPDQKMVPYIGAFTGIVWNDKDITGTVGPEVGVRFFVWEKTFILTQYRYEWFFEDLDLDDLGDDLETLDDNKSEGNHVASIGIGFAWN